MLKVCFYVLKAHVDEELKSSVNLKPLFSLEMRTVGSCLHPEVSISIILLQRLHGNWSKVHQMELKE